MTSMIWLGHFGKLLIVYRSVCGVESLIFHTAEGNGRDSSLLLQFGDFREANCVIASSCNSYSLSLLSDETCKALNKNWGLPVAKV